MQSNNFSAFKKDMAQSSVKFDKNGDGIARYTIFNYQKDENGRSDYKIIGKWHSQLMMDAKDVIWSYVDPSTTTTMVPEVSSSTTSLTSFNGSEDNFYETTTMVGQTNAFGMTEEHLDDDGIPQSVCSFPCKTGEIMIMNTVGYILSKILFKHIFVMKD